MPPDAQPDPADKPAKPRANRRWYQFSLRAMFVWVTVVGVLLAVGLRWIAPAQRQRAVVQLVKRLEGTIAYGRTAMILRINSVNLRIETERPSQSSQDKSNER